MTGPKPSFSPTDELLLLQLQTRRSMAVRTEKEAAALDEEGAQEDAAAQIAEEVPSLWRLVPEQFTPHPWQIDCLARWLPNARGTVKVATGGGKTLFALLAAQRLQNERAKDLRLVIVVPTIPLMRQWRDELAGSNLPGTAIAMLGGGESPGDLSQIRVLIAVINSAREKLPKMAVKAGWGTNLLLIVDECHRAAADQARRIFDSMPSYTLGLSATPERDAQEEGMPTDEAYAGSELGRALGAIFFEFSLKDSLAAGLLTHFEVWHVGLSLSAEEAEKHAALSTKISELRRDLQPRHRASKSKLGFIHWCQSKAKEDAEAAQFMGLTGERKRLLYRAAARTEIAVRILRENASEGTGRTIVFHESIEEIERLFLRAVEQGLPAVLEHSKLPDGLREANIEAFRKGVARMIISAKSLVEGFNVPSADLGIIAASSGSVRQRIQSLGRMLRRKFTGQSAKVIVLYVRDTEDEAIYEKADWEAVVGAERNRYFYWQPHGESDPWREGLQERNEAPRTYRPSCFEVDPAGMTFEGPYPAQTGGEELKVDSAGNLRARSDERMITATARQIEAVQRHNRGGYAVRTPAGHLIVRTEAPRGSEGEWRYLGLVAIAAQHPALETVKLQVRQKGARTLICRAGKGGSVDYALGPGQSRTPQAGELCVRLLEWIQTIQKELGVNITNLYWDGDSTYWLEAANARRDFPGPAIPLEFNT